MVAANQEAFAATQSFQGLPYTFTSLYMDNYIWTGLFPLALVMTFSKSPRLKALGILALPATLFNIGEPLIFGIPIMMNPVLMIPFVLSYVMLAIISVTLTSFGILPTPVLLFLGLCLHQLKHSWQQMHQFGQQSMFSLDGL